MKLTLQKFVLGMGIAVLFAACSKKNGDDLPAAPTVALTELGSGNSKIAYAGADLHLDAEILAPGNIASIQVEIHPEGAGDWKYDSLYTEGFVGLKNAEFHKHIDIPDDVAPGSYHFHLVVTDQRGQRKEVEDELEIRVDPTLPSLAGLELALNAAKTELHLEAEITAPNNIASIVVEIHGPWEKEFEYTDAAMVGQSSYHFHKHINISEAPAGHYHVHIKIVDQAGKEREFEDHFNK